MLSRGFCSELHYYYNAVLVSLTYTQDNSFEQLEADASFFGMTSEGSLIKAKFLFYGFYLFFSLSSRGTKDLFTEV